MRKLFNKVLGKWGYNITKTQNYSSSLCPFSKINLTSAKIVDLYALAQISSTIPGMISPESGQFLYTLCYMQELKGDVIEIGAWQGRSTSFLARAVANSKNGKFFSIDHFKGNKGKEKLYRVYDENLSDLKENFLKNMKMLDLLENINLLDMPNNEAIKKLKDIQIRFLFIDGDHSKEGVNRDIQLFFPKLMPGSIIVFDDFSEEFSGLIEAVDNLLSVKKFSRIMSYPRTLVLQV